MLKIGLLGAGRIAGVHATAILRMRAVRWWRSQTIFQKMRKNWLLNMVQRRAQQMKLLPIRQLMLF